MAPRDFIFPGFVEFVLVYLRENLFEEARNLKSIPNTGYVHETQAFEDGSVKHLQRLVKRWGMTSFAY